MKNTPIPYGRQWIDEQDIDAVVRVLKSDFLTQGPAIAAFEQDLAAYVGARYAVAFSSGTAALHGSYAVAGLKCGDTFLTTPHTFAATANAGVYLGARPVFCDVETDTANIDVDVLPTPPENCRLITPVHFAGLSCDMEKIAAYAQEHALMVVEDACHALGGSYNGTKIGACAFSDMTVFSFHPVKHVAMGEGGAVTTNNEALYRALCAFRTHGIVRDSFEQESHGGWYMEMQSLGYNYRLTDMQAALGSSQLKKLDASITRRQAIAEAYRTAFAGTVGIEPFAERDYANHAYHLFPILTDTPEMRKPLFDTLRAEGILVQVHYIPVYKHPYYQHNGYADVVCSVAESLYNRIVSLPMYPTMTDEDVARVIRTVQDIVGDLV